MMAFHDALEQSLRTATPEIKVGVLAGLHERGALDLDVRDENGLNLLGRMMVHTPLTPEIIDFLDGINRTDLYAEPSDGTWPLMDRQTWFLINKRLEPDSLAIAKMIDRVNPSWWKSLDHPKGDEGSTLVAALAPLSVAEQPLTALWKRGVSPHARLGNDERMLACLHLNMPDSLDAYIKAGGELAVPVMLTPGRDYPMWRDILKRNDKLADYFVSLNGRGLLDPDQFKQDHYLKNVHKARRNVSEMIKLLTQHPNWNALTLYNGDPAWMSMIQSRPELIENFIERKRKRPDFTERDHMGRSLWFVASIRGPGLPIAKLFDLLEKEIPSAQHMKSSDGLGLLPQVLNEVQYRKKKTGMLKVALGFSGKASDENMLAGLENFNFKRLYDNADDGENGAGILVELLAKPELHSRLTPVQRGHILGGVLLGDVKLQYDDENLLTSILKTDTLRDFLNLGVHWPQVDHQRLKARAEHPKRKHKHLDGKALIEEWVSCLHRQAIEADTPHIQTNAQKRARL